MSEVDAKKLELISDIRTGELTPQQAVNEFNKITPAQIRTGRIYVQKSAEERVNQYREAKRIREEIRSNRVPFISKHFLQGLWLSQGLILVGAESGRAKSTTASNILAGFIRSVPDKTAFVISNEEQADAVYQRTACVLLGISFQALTDQQLSSREVRKVDEFVEQEIAPRAEVIAENTFDMSYLDDVQSVLETASVDGIGLVLVDYLQCITQSRKEPDLEAFQISKKLGFYLKDFGIKNGIPVVLFAQLNDSTSSATFASRVQNDKTMFNHSFLAVEVMPDFETLTTKFKVHKDRFFGCTGKEVVLAFKGGRYEFPDESI